MACNLPHLPTAPPSHRYPKTPAKPGGMPAACLGSHTLALYPATLNGWTLPPTTTYTTVCCWIPHFPTALGWWNLPAARLFVSLYSAFRVSAFLFVRMVHHCAAWLPACVYITTRLLCRCLLPHLPTPPQFRSATMPWDVYPTHDALHTPLLCCENPFFFPPASLFPTLPHAFLPPSLITLFPGLIFCLLPHLTMPLHLSLTLDVSQSNGLRLPDTHTRGERWRGGSIMVGSPTTGSLLSLPQQFYINAAVRLQHTSRLRRLWRCERRALTSFLPRYTPLRYLCLILQYLPPLLIS